MPNKLSYPADNKRGHDTVLPPALEEFSAQRRPLEGELVPILNLSSNFGGEMCQGSVPGPKTVPAFTTNPIPEGPKKPSGLE